MHKNSSAASPFRIAPDGLAAQAAFVRSQPAAGLLDAVQVPMMLLNADRQIVYSNPALLDLVEAALPDDIAGLRPGEALECVRAEEADYGCGTGPHCASCGALRTILNAQAGLATRDLCQITRRSAAGGERSALLRVWGAPVEIAAERFTALGVLDGSDALHRAALERTLFDKVAQAGLEVERLAECLAPDAASRPALAAAGRRIERLVRRHAVLAAAESGMLNRALRPAAALELLESAIASVAGDLPGQVAITVESDAAAINTDAELAAVALEEMLANALEAARPREVVEAGWRATRLGHEFWVRNAEPVPIGIRDHLFQPGVSSRGPGRGLGTYLMKLIAECHLGASVDCETGAEGTRFSIHFPETSPLADARGSVLGGDGPGEGQLS